ncbi:hypothetical protein HNR23_003773 [Nocardiopsis mwathae]|uniref:Uncharacterized protein n=1 Tax=Nocardiopsis mwathae TaxID=1472723 RepID=A0A7W9YK88_9ACTN|nr:hypothetical protein [Nocardiopsis mwathae]MBB6173713.1 hypothetical protein [Nocardiopsis mwathae]
MPIPAYPPDWSSAWSGLQKRLRTARTAAQSRVRFAAVRAAGILVGGGGSLQVAGRREQDRMLHVGSDDEGGGARLWLGRPRDGSAVLDLRAAEGEAGQWALRDQVGNAVVAEGPEGVGLARPVMPVAAHWVTMNEGRVRWDAYAFGGGRQSVLECWAVFQHTAVSFAFLAWATPKDATLELVVHKDGTAHSAGVRRVAAGGPVTGRTVRFDIDGTRFLDYSGPLLVELVATTHDDGSSGLNVAVLYSHGAGRVPEAQAAQ